MKRYYEEYSDNEAYGSDEYEYEIPPCFCGKDAKRRISFTDKNPGRPFFNCYKRNWDKQCGFFVWEDELYSDDESSDDESSSVCDSCLEKGPCDGEIAECEPDQYIKRINDMPLFDQSSEEAEPACCKCLKLKRKIDEIESAKDDWDREKLELLAKLEAVESEFRHLKKKSKLASETDDKALLFEKLAYSAEETVESEFGQIGKKSKLANETADMPPFENVSDLGQLIVETKLAIEADDDKPLLFEKLSNSNNGTVESEFWQMGKKFKPDDMFPFENLSNSRDEILESDLGQLIAKTKLAIEADGDEPLLSEKLCKSNDETVESELGRIGKKSKLANEAADMPPFENVSDFGQLIVETKIAIEADADKPLLFEKLSNSNNGTVESEFWQMGKKFKPEDLFPFKNLSISQDEIIESDLGQLIAKTKLAIEADGDEPLLSEKLCKSNDETVESELGRIGKKSKLATEADDMPPFEKLSNSEDETLGSELSHIIAKNKLANKDDDMPLLNKLSNSDEETVEVEFGQTKKKSKLAEVDYMPPLEKLSKSKDDEAVESELGQIRKKIMLANEAASA